MNGLEEGDDPPVSPHYKIATDAYKYYRFCYLIIVLIQSYRSISGIFYNYVTK